MGRGKTGTILTEQKLEAEERIQYEKVIQEEMQLKRREHAGYIDKR
jgi:hypothetical protein